MINDYTYAWRHIFSLLKKYWIVFAVFIPYGFIAGKFKFDNTAVFLLNLLGLKSSYNNEWWYVGQYLFMMMLFPFINILTDKLFELPAKTKRAIAGSLFFCILVFAFGCWKSTAFANIVVPLMDIPLIVYSIIFIEGVYYKKTETAEIKDSKLIPYSNITSFVGLLIIAFLRTHFATVAYHCASDIFLVVPFILCAIQLLGNLRIANVLAWFGKYSTYIWLTHTFFCYYYFPNVIASAKISIFIFICTAALSTITGIALTSIEKTINRKIAFHS